MNSIDSNILNNLNQAQKKAVTYNNGPLLIIAGAGTGKTTVITRRIAWLTEQGLAKPEEILAVTFTDKASTEMSDRVDQLMSLSYGDTEISTFHAFAKKILTQHALDIGLPGDFKLLTDTDLWILVRSHIHDFKLNYYKPIGDPSRFIHALIKHFQKAKGEGITPEQYLDHAQSLKLNLDNTIISKKVKSKKAKIKNDLSEEDLQEAVRVSEIAEAFHIYQKLLLDQSFLDFGDLINYSLQLFQTRPKILKQYQDKFKYILVDEFQDTDLAQYKFIKFLSQPSNNITVVGDDDQSIYKFRGASVSNILMFEKDFPKCEKITLTENFRSVQPILDLSYNFIQLNNPERLESKLKISKKLVSNIQTSHEINLIHAKNVYEEAAQVVEKIKILREKESLNFNDFAILVRANDHAEPFLSELSRQGLPYIFWANKGLYKKEFILDILSYLRLLDDYHEAENLLRVMNFPKFYIPEEEFVLISHLAKQKAVSIFELLKDARNLIKLPQETYTKIDLLLSDIFKHSQLARTRPISELLVKILQDLDLLKDLMDDSYANQEKRSLLEQFYRKSQNFEEQSEDKTGKAFLSLIQLELDSGFEGDLAFNPDAGPEAIKIMTIHTAKGLEFSCVFLANLVDQRFPSRERKDPIEIPENLIGEILPEGDAHLMEERRLFYVGVTRAKRFLYFSWADNYGGSTIRKPSRFLVESGLVNAPEKVKSSGKVFFTEQMPRLLIKSKIKVPDTFSFSQISTFLHCPLEYKYKYIYHLPMSGSAQLSFGQTIHKTLELYLNKVFQLNASNHQDLFGSSEKKFKVPEKEELFKVYSESWVDDWFTDKIQKEEYRKRGIDMLEKFYENFINHPTRQKFLEKSFKLKLDKYKLVGKIDRADINSDGTIDIIDYKTGAPREKLDPVDKQQLLIYQWAAKEAFNEKVKSLTYAYLIKPELVNNFLGTDLEIEAVKHKFFEVIQTIVKTVENKAFLQEDLRAGSHDCQFRDLEHG